MARVKRTTLVPWIAVVVPTAQMSVAETAEILDSTAFAKLVPAGTASDTDTPAASEGPAESTVIV